MTRDELVQVLVDGPQHVSRRVLSPAALRVLPFVAVMAVLLIWAFALARASARAPTRALRPVTTFPRRTPPSDWGTRAVS